MLRDALAIWLTHNNGRAQISPFKKIGTDERYVEEVLITAGDDVNQVLLRARALCLDRPCDLRWAGTDPALH